VKKTIIQYWAKDTYFVEETVDELGEIKQKRELNPGIKEDIAQFCFMSAAEESALYDKFDNFKLIPLEASRDRFTELVRFFLDQGQELEQIFPGGDLVIQNRIEGRTFLINFCSKLGQPHGRLPKGFVFVNKTVVKEIK